MALLLKTRSGQLTGGSESDSIRLLAQPFPLARSLGFSAGLNTEPPVTSRRLSDSGSPSIENDSLRSAKRKFADSTYFLPPSITVNRLRRSGAVSVGSGVATASTASSNSPIDQA